MKRLEFFGAAGFDKMHFQMATSLAKRSIVAAALTLLALAQGSCVAAAQSSQWKFFKNRDGLVKASLLSTNGVSVGSGVIDYHPALILSCKPTRAQVWRQAIQLQAPLRRDDSTSVRLRYDEAAPFTEKWAVDEGSTVLFVDGPDRMARLARTRRLSVSWSSGIFSRSGEVIFDLSGVRDAVATVAEGCGIKPPILPGGAS